MKKWTPFLAIFLAFSLFGCSADSPDRSEVVADINDYPLTVDEFRYQLSLATNLEEGQKTNPLDADKLKAVVEKSFLTEAGRKLAEDVLF